MDFEELIGNPPKLHQEGGKATSYQASNDVLKFICDNISERSCTIETGAGLSTIIFALQKSQHICVVPDKDLVERIINFCDNKGILTQSISFQVDKSQYFLPKVVNPNSWDLVFIDGDHAFPIPFIDWYYTSQQLKVGGILVIDDLQIWTGRILKDFLKSEPEWKTHSVFGNRAIAYVKIKEISPEKWWGQQLFVIKNSRLSTRKQFYRLKLKTFLGWK